MKLHNLDNRNRKFKVSIKGFQLGFNEQLNINQNIKQLLESVPKDSNIELRIEHGNNAYKARLEVKDSVFGCIVDFSSETLDHTISKIFKAAYKEFEVWRSNPANRIIFVPHTAGFPSHLKSRVW